MVTAGKIPEAIVATTIMIRQRVTDEAITTNVAIEITIIVRKKITVSTGVSTVTHVVIATDHIETDAMVAGNERTSIYYCKKLIGKGR